MKKTQEKKHTREVGSKAIIQLWATFNCEIKEKTFDHSGTPTYTVYVPSRLTYFYDIYEAQLFDTIEEL